MIISTTTHPRVVSVPLLSIQFCAPRALRSNLGWGLGSTRRATTGSGARRPPGGGLPATRGGVYGGKAPGSRGWAAACQRHADPSPGTRVGGTYPRTPQGNSWSPRPARPGGSAPARGRLDNLLWPWHLPGPLRPSDLRDSLRGDGHLRDLLGDSLRPGDDLLRAPPDPLRPRDLDPLHDDERPSRRPGLLGPPLTARPSSSGPGARSARRARWTAGAPRCGEPREGPKGLQPSDVARGAENPRGPRPGKG